MTRAMARRSQSRSKPTKWRSVSTDELTPAPENDTPDNPAEPRVYTAEDLAALSAKELSELVGGGRVNGVMSREKEAGKRAAERQVLETLGFTSVDEAKSWTQKKREEDSAKLSDAERAQREAEATSAQAEADRRQAAADRQAAKIERTLIRAGVDDASMDDAMRLVALEPDADEATITSAVETLKGRIPALFGSATAPTPPAPSGGPGGTPPRPAPSGDAYQRGIERAKARREAAAGSGIA